jgi:hypothetical protein
LGQYAQEVFTAFERVQKQWPAITGTELTVTFANAVGTATVDHGLGEEPNRFVVCYAPLAQAVGMTAVDERQATFARSSTSSAATFYVRVYRDPAAGDV